MPRAYARQEKACTMCTQPSHSKGLCRSHYHQQLRANRVDGRALVPTDGTVHLEGDPCTIEGCDRPIKILSRGLCQTHYSRLRYGGDVDPTRPVRAHGQGWHIGSDGYRILGSGEGKVLEHRYVMEQMLGRPLESFENVPPPQRRTRRQPARESRTVGHPAAARPAGLRPHRMAGRGPPRRSRSRVERGGVTTSNSSDGREPPRVPPISMSTERASHRWH